MANWQSLDYSDLFPAEVTAIASSASTAASSISSVLSALASVTSALSALVGLFTDPVSGIVNVLLQDINDLINDVRNTDVFFLAVSPEVGGIDKFATTVGESFFDLGDPQRPIFSDGAAIGGVVVTVGGPSLANFQTLLNQTGDIFGVSAFKDVLRQANRNLPSRLEGTVTAINTITKEVTDSTLNLAIDAFTGRGFRLRSGTAINRSFVITGNTAIAFKLLEATSVLSDIAVGDRYIIDVGVYESQAPDWKRTRIANVIPPIGDLFDILNIVSRQFEAAIATSTTLSQLATVLSAKATQLSTLSTQLDTAVTNLTALLAGTGASILTLPEATGGIRGFQDSLQTAGSKPFDDSAFFVAGIVVVAGTGNFTILDQIF